ncbi:MAG: hypothetical protein ACJ8R9_14260 [Steroidobacteraceae bacterium]
MTRFMQLSWVQLTLLTLVLALAMPCHAQRKLEVGVGVHMGDYPLPATQAALNDLNVSLRADVPWKDIEVTPGNLQYPTSASSPLGKLDTLVTDAVRRQHKPVLILAYGNKAYDGGGLITSQRGIDAFAKYAAFTVAHFKGRAADFEVWNEWNHGVGVPPERRVPGDARAYVNLLRATAQSIKSANPQARVLGGAVAGTDTAWITQFAQAQGLQYVDGLSVHPYVHCNARAVPRAPGDLKLQGKLYNMSSGSPVIRVSQSGPVLSPIGGTPEQAIAWLDQVKALLDQYSPSRPVPVYVTEIGWPTSKGQCGVPPEAAAAYLQRFMLLAATRPWIAGVWWYDLFDDGDDPGSREHRFGLAGKNRSPKAAYAALSALADVLQSSQVPSEKIDPEGSLTITGTDARGKPFHAAWLPTDMFDASQAWSQGSQLLKQGFRAQAGPATDAALSATPLLMQQK